MSDSIQTDKATLDDLVERLRDGDVAAGEQLIRAYEPYLRMIVRRRISAALRPKFDSIDIVQSIWADVFQRFGDGEWDFADANKLRAFLATVARNRFIDRSRHHLRGDKYINSYDNEFLDELPIAATNEIPVVDLWDRLLAVCPPGHRELLELKREGFSLEEIANKTGLHKSSVRRIIYELARRLAAEEESAV